MFNFLRRNKRETSNVLSRADMINMAMTFLDRNQISGDYFEFGVYRAKTFRSAYHAAQKKKLNMRFYAFDSFQGLPELEKEDRGGRFKAGDYEMSEEDFVKILDEEGIDKGDYEVIKGFYEDSLVPELELAYNKVSLVHYDCDLYSSTKTALNWSSQFFQEGTILLFDDFYHYKGSPHCGQQKALNEFIASQEEYGVVPYQRYTWQSKAFIVYKK